MSITLTQMIQQGSVLRLIGMAVLFVIIGFLINAIGSKKDAAPDAVLAPAAAGNMGAVTAAISAAVSEYKKN